MKILKPTGFLFIGLCFVYLLMPFSPHAQNSLENYPSEVVGLYLYSEAKYPINDEIVNGCIYPLPDSRILGDPYFGSNDWHEGTLFINGADYPKIMLKFDLIINELIIKAKVSENIERLITINKSQIDSFRMGASLFVNSRELFPDEEINTYYEQVYRGKLSVYKTYQKNFIDMFSSSSPEGKYSAQKSTTYLFYNRKFTNINKVKSFYECFDKTEQDKIKKYLKANKIAYKKMTDLQMVGLMDFCNSNIKH